MKRPGRIFAAALVLFGVAPTLVAQQAAVQMTQPAVAVAKQWLERIDAGDAAGAWRDANAVLRDKDDIESWTGKVARARGTAAVKCRVGLDFEIRDDGIEAIFTTTFVDGKTIGERVMLTGDATAQGDITRYRAVRGKFAPSC